MNNVPEELDWVSERAKCTPESVLEVLRRQVVADVEQRTKLKTDREIKNHLEFVLDQGTRNFRVSVKDWRNDDLASAIFGRVAEGIQILYQDASGFVGYLTLANDGKCRLKVENEELTFWQFRKKALEPVFFGILKDLDL